MDFTATLLVKKPELVEVPVYSQDGQKTGSTTLPNAFSSPMREELVRRAYIHLSTHSLQPKGASRLSGHKHSVESWGPGFGMARVSRIRGRGTPKYGSGAMVPSAVGGRPTHPPVPEKKIRKELNKKELKNATLSALAFTTSAEKVRERGHRVPQDLPLPIVVEDSVESLEKTKEVRSFLLKLGLGEELERCAEVKIRAGKGKKEAGDTRVRGACDSGV
ncbi:MAG: 50S ribosomal protein L4 [Candidatus Caldarchaeum sp.]|nr:50S ribosomal protein L4 [Candidatus Caldarchaeum sp.]